MKCVSNQLRKHVTSAFKLCYSQIDPYHRGTYYIDGTKTFWVVPNNSFPLECIDKVSNNKGWLTNKCIRFFYTISKDAS